jgi:hypothetical protein
MSNQNDWRGIMKILWLEHRDAQGNIIQKQENIRNLLHYEGEEFILQAIFLGGKTNNTFIPTNYFGAPRV